jgi:hypothetical protein
MRRREGGTLRRRLFACSARPAVQDAPLTASDYAS